MGCHLYSTDTSEKMRACVGVDIEHLLRHLWLFQIITGVVVSLSESNSECPCSKGYHNVVFAMVLGRDSACDGILLKHLKFVLLTQALKETLTLFVLNFNLLEKLWSPNSQSSATKLFTLSFFLVFSITNWPIYSRRLTKSFEELNKELEVKLLNFVAGNLYSWFYFPSLQVKFLNFSLQPFICLMQDAGVCFLAGMHKGISYMNVSLCISHFLQMFVSFFYFLFLSLRHIEVNCKHHMLL